jgi:hypothetical protein
MLLMTSLEAAAATTLIIRAAVRAALPRAFQEARYCALSAAAAEAAKDGGVPCFSCRMMDLRRDTSFVFLAAFGLKSHSLATRSHAVPGSIGSDVDWKSRSADCDAARWAAWRART